MKSPSARDSPRTKALPAVRDNLAHEAFVSPGRNLDLPPDTRELVWQWLGESHYAYAVAGDGRRQMLNSLERDRLEESALARIRRVMAGPRDRLGRAAYGLRYLLLLPSQTLALVTCNAGALR